MLALTAWPLLGTLPAAADATQLPLAVCVAENDPPRSARGAGSDAWGIDLDVARMLAAKLERPLRLAWMPERAQTDIESTDLDFRPLLRGECDALLSVPGGALGRLGNRLALSTPYYAAAYELVPADSSFRWGEPYAGTIAVSANSLAHVAVNAIGVRWTMQEASAEVVAALNAGAASAGLVWGPDFGLLDDAARRSEAFEPPAVLRWNLHAATRRDAPVLADLNAVFAQDSVKRDILALLSRHRIPSRRPFETTHTRAALTALRNLPSP